MVKNALTRCYSFVYAYKAWLKKHINVLIVYFVDRFTLSGLQVSMFSMSPIARTCISPLLLRVMLHVPRSYAIIRCHAWHVTPAMPLCVACGSLIALPGKAYAYWVRYDSTVRSAMVAYIHRQCIRWSAMCIRIVGAKSYDYLITAIDALRYRLSFCDQLNFCTLRWLYFLLFVILRFISSRSMECWI